jgi:hypothetical protein
MFERKGSDKIAAQTLVGACLLLASKSEEVRFAKQY